MAESSFPDQTIVIPGPAFHVDLAALDALHPVHYSQRLLIFRCASHGQRDEQLTTLRAGLQALVLRCPILAGLVTPLPHDEARSVHEDWRTIVPDRGLELVVRDLRSKVDSFAELEMAHFPPLKLPYHLLMPVPQDIGNDRPFAACKIQFSAIEGGTIITFAMSHSVADGAGTNELMRVLREETRLSHMQSDGVRHNGEASKPAVTLMGEDRTIMRTINSAIPFNINDHPAYTSDQLQLPQSHPFIATSPEIPILLRISPTKLAQLKLDATTPGAPPISTHDALVALMWRSVLLIRSRRSGAARALPPTTLGSMFFPSDARRQIGLPPSYMGNAVYQLTADLELGTLLSPSGLRNAASAVRAAIKAATPEVVASLMAETNKRWLYWAFLGSYSTTAVGMGTDWTSAELYDQDWGEIFGPLVSYRYPGTQGGGISCIMPKLQDGGAEVFVSVMPEEVELLSGPECFGKYLEDNALL
jgi:hypothetical protein